MANGLIPAFAFGHGVSSTTFAIKEPRLLPPAKGENSYRIEATVSNTGARRGAEVLQVYLSVPSRNGVQQPPKRLVGFQKVWLEPGASERMTIEIDPTASNHPLSIWDSAQNEFVIPKGLFTVWVGNASDSLTKAGTFER